MTPQERQLIDDLFERLAKLESAPRDGEATAAIAQGLRSAPNAVYPLVQTVLVQDEALKRADAHIQELVQALAAASGQGQGTGQNQSGGFLDSMRDKILGQGGSRGSVPNVPPPLPENRPVWNSGQVMGQMPPGQGPYGQGYGQGGYGQGGYGQGAPQSPFGGGSFLGTAAATAAGMVGGSLLLNSIRGMMGGGSRQAFGDTAMGGERASSPWSDQSNSPMARDLGADDIGRSGDRGDDNSRAGFFDQASNDGTDQDDMDMDSDDFGGGDDSDYA
jgi:hypothetical protein